MNNTIGKRVVLGIETSCDETAVSLVDEQGSVLSDEVLSQVEHSNFGGVVPELAARKHYDSLHILVERALSTAGKRLCEIDAVAVTAGPGLIGSLIVGVMFAKAICFANNKPIIPINHLEAHVLISRMTEDIEFPFLALIISGGHCQLVLAEDVGNYKKLGETLDDSLGEAFDKVSRMLGLGYPGGKVMEEKALKGRGDRFLFPIALKGRAGSDFSFSGLKTAVRNVIIKAGELDDQLICDICASFQSCVAATLTNRIHNALSFVCSTYPKVSKLIITGGVAANNFLRHKISEYVNTYGISTVFPPKNLCTDNGVMVAWAGIENMRKNIGIRRSLEFAPVSRWPIYERVL